MCCLCLGTICECILHCTHCSCNNNDLKTEICCFFFSLKVNKKRIPLQLQCQKLEGQFILRDILRKLICAQHPSAVHLNYLYEFFRQYIATLTKMKCRISICHTVSTQFFNNGNQLVVFVEIVCFFLNMCHCNLFRSKYLYTNFIFSYTLLGHMQE